MHAPATPAPSAVQAGLNLPPAAPAKTAGPADRTGLFYPAVVVASLLAFAMQPGRAEAPAHDAALMSLATWAAGGLADGDAPAPAAPVTPPH